MKFNPNIPQATCFFIYLHWDDEATPQLQTHVVFGVNKPSLDRTRKLVQSGSQVDELLYLGPVCDLIPHHQRMIRSMTETITPEDNTRCPRCGSADRATRNEVTRRSNGLPGPCPNIWHEVSAQDEQEYDPLAAVAAARVVPS